jgi:hypothetical protein
VAPAAALEHDMKQRCVALILLLMAPVLVLADLHVVIVEGLGGDPVYAAQFSAQADAIEAASLTLTADDNIKSFRGDAATRETILSHFETLKSRLTANDQISMFLVGHGSYDDVEYKFNVAGPDLTGEDIATSLDALASTSQLLVNTSSASGATVDLLQNDNRVLLLATRSGAERHATRFGGYFADALSNSTADTDKNQRISAAEAFNFAARQVDDYYESNGQLATEHPRIEGERTARVTLARLDSSRPTIIDVALAELVADRDALNTEIETLRLARDDMDMQDYQAQLLQKMLELARIEDAIEAREGDLSAPD